MASVSVIPLAPFPFADHSIMITISTAPVYCIFRPVYFRQDRAMASPFVAPDINICHFLLLLRGAVVDNHGEETCHLAASPQRRKRKGAALLPHLQHIPHLPKAVPLHFIQIAWRVSWINSGGHLQVGHADGQLHHGHVNGFRELWKYAKQTLLAVFCLPVGFHPGIRL